MPQITYQTDEIVDVPPLAAVISGDRLDRAPHVRFQFRDLAELVALVPQCEPAGALDESPWRNGGKWHGTDNMQDALNLASNGWIDGATKAKDAAARLDIARPTKNRVSRQCAVAGALPDVARAIAGNPAHMRQIKPRDVAGRIVTLIVDFSASARISQERMLLNAVCAAGTVDAMEAAGFRVELVARSGWINGLAVASDVAIVAKRADEPLDLGKLAFMCGHPAMLRRLVFGLQCTQPAVARLTDTMGHPCCSAPDPERGMYVVPLPQNNLPESEDVAEIFDGMVAALREQGCPGFAE